MGWGGDLKRDNTISLTNTIQETTARQESGVLFLHERKQDTLIRYLIAIGI